MTDLDRAKSLLRPLMPAIVAQVEATLAARNAATFSAEHDGGGIDADMLARVVEKLVAEQLGSQSSREDELDSVAREYDLTPSERAELERRVRS